MIQSTKTPSLTEDATAISTFLGQRLKSLGFKKRQNGFNRRFDNGLTHQISIFRVGAYSIDHGKFYIHAGCYVPEAELFRRNVTEPKWVTDALCAVRGRFPESYLSLRKVAAKLDILTPHVDDVLEALKMFENYDSVMGDMIIANQLAQKSPLRFETPQPIVKACVQIAREDVEGASRTIRQYLAAKTAAKEAHLGHVEMVQKWAEELRLL